MAEALKSEDIGMKRGRVLAQLTPARQLDIVAEGLPILLKSADELMTAAEALDDHSRAAAILMGQATEELSKILILMDIVRCPPKVRGGLVGQMFKWFYDHLPRLLYAEAQGWKPMTVGQLQEYLDNSRRSHDIEGFAGEFIMPKSTFLARFARVAHAPERLRRTEPVRSLGRLEPEGVGFTRIIAISYPRLRVR